MGAEPQNRPAVGQCAGTVSSPDLWAGAQEAGLGQLALAGAGPIRGSQTPVLLRGPGCPSLLAYFLGFLKPQLSGQGCRGRGGLRGPLQKS